MPLRGAYKRQKYSTVQTRYSKFSNPHETLCIAAFDLERNLSGKFTSVIVKISCSLSPVRDGCVLTTDYFRADAAK